jgi:hypothetical protein
MAKNYRSLTESVRSRINPESLILEKAFTDELSSVSYSDVLVYIRYAMKGVESTYTQKSIDAGENAKDHLKKSLSDVAYRYQGSVMTNTHIKGHSDIDLLIISDKFYTWDSYETKKILESADRRSTFQQSSIQKLETEVNNSAYTGNAIEDLRQLRLACEQVLSTQYTKCDVTKGKAIKITNLGLKRDVDVVVSNWYDDVRSIIYNKGENRGIQIYNKDTNSKESPDYPFVSIERINQRGAETQGRLKKMIRFLKNVKADSTLKIELSSFDINAICYDINPAIYRTQTFTQLVPTVFNQLKSICTDKSHSDEIASVDEREYIFRGQDQKLEYLKLLYAEVIGIYGDLSGTQL